MRMYPNWHRSCFEMAVSQDIVGSSPTMRTKMQDGFNGKTSPK